MPPSPEPELPAGDLAFSIGHSTHRLDDFLDLLHVYGVRQLVDVRAHPGSRRLPWFSREALMRALPVRECAYVHLPQLGGRRRPRPDSPNGAWEVEAFRGYADHMSTPEFAAGLEELEALARESPTVMMCAEAVWWRCHRRLIADGLTRRGWRVEHIGPDGGTTVHELTAFAVLESGQLTYPPAQERLDLT